MSGGRQLRRDAGARYYCRRNLIYATTRIALPGGKQSNSVLRLVNTSVYRKVERCGIRIADGTYIERRYSLPRRGLSSFANLICLLRVLLYHCSVSPKSHL